MDIVRSVIERLREFETEAKRILTKHEASPTRIITIEDTYSKLGRLSLKQDALLRESLTEVQSGHYKAAYVLAWAAFMDFLDEKLGEDGFKKLRQVRPKWRVRTTEDLREVAPDVQVIEAGQLVGIYGKTVKKALKGLLNQRNECAHPSDYSPGLNETLGFLAQLLKRITVIQSKKIKP